MSHLVLDMRKTINATKNLDVANRVATLITKVPFLSNSILHFF